MKRPTPVAHEDEPMAADFDPESIAGAILARAMEHEHSQASGHPTGGDTPMVVLAYRVVGALCVGDEPPLPDCVTYPWSQDRATRERNVARALYMSWCLRTGVTFTEGDLDEAAEALTRGVRAVVGGTS